MLGVDISDFQEGVNFKEVKADGIHFVYSKATEGTNYTADSFAIDHDRCKANGISFGAYHFLHFGQDPVAQAEHFLAATNGRLGNLLPMVDVEGGGQDGVTDLPTLVNTLSAFNAHVEKTVGKKIIIYSDYGDWNGFMQGTSAFSGHKFWIAEFNSDASPSLPSGVTTWVVWQKSSSATFPGIHGKVDLDVLNGSNLSIIER
jgi:lysozyme